jgi:hypothetical protein
MNLHQRNRGRTYRLLGAIVAVAMFAQAYADSSPAAAATAPAAVWSPRELTFQYQGFTTTYSCDGLQQRMRKLLVKLGARPDLEVTAFGCTRLAGPDLLAGVRIKMDVLQPAPADAAKTVTAHWMAVDLLADRNPLDAAADCELIDQIKQKVLPAFTTRNVDFKATCAAHQVVIGSTYLKAEVLSAAAAAAAAAR